MWLSGKRARRVNLSSSVLPWVSYSWVLTLFSIKSVVC